jgi:hypothetical protein
MDNFNDAADSLIAPARSVFVITSSDTASLPIATKAIYVGRGGDLVLRAVGDGAAVRFTNVANGAILPIRVAAVLATGTTASDLVGLI